MTRTQNIDEINRYIKELDIKQLNNSPNKAHEIHAGFIHNYSELAAEIRRITSTKGLTQIEKDKLLDEVADTITDLTNKLKQVK